MDVTRRQFIKDAGVLGAATILLSAFPSVAQALIYLPQPNIPVILYHNFSQDEGAALYTPIEVFGNDLEYLHQEGYQVISMRQLIDYLLGKIDLPGKPLVINFDDGYKSNYSEAFPILKKYQVPVTLFMITSKVGTPGYLSWEDLREMETSGLVDVQAHTHDLHYEVFYEPRLKKTRPVILGEGYLPELKRYETKEEFETKLLNDFIANRVILESTLAKEDVDIFAWPFGAYNNRALKIAQSAEFKYFATLLPGVNRQGTSPSFIRRKQCSGNVSISRFSKIINSKNS